jgi:hypothetical protein
MFEKINQKTQPHPKFKNVFAYRSWPKFPLYNPPSTLYSLKKRTKTVNVIHL